jgi:hypothetical protein
VSKTPRTITSGYTAPEKRPGPLTCKLVDNATTSQTHSFDARVPHNIRNAQIFRIQSHASYSKNASNPPRIMGWLHRAGERSHPKRKWQHTVATHERPKSGSSPKHETPACEALPLGQIMPLVCLHQSPSSGAPAGSTLIQLEICVPLQPRTENTFKPPVI